MYYQVPGFLGKKKIADYKDAQKLAKNDESLIEIVLSHSEYSAFLHEIDTLKAKVVRTENECRAKVDQIEKDRRTQVAALERREHGLREALSRHSQKSTGKKEDNRPYREEYDGNRHRIYVRLPLPTKTDYKDAYRFAEDEIRRIEKKGGTFPGLPETTKIRGYFLKHVTRNGETWQAVYER